MKPGLDKVQAAYFEAMQEQPELPPWGALSLELREAFIHVYTAGRIDALTEQAEKRGLQ